MDCHNLNNLDMANIHRVMICRICSNKIYLLKQLSHFKLALINILDKVNNKIINKIYTGVNMDLNNLDHSNLEIKAKILNILNNNSR
jgi:hypothetical protein